MLWEVDIYPKPGQPDLTAAAVARDAADLGLAEDLAVAAARGYLIQGDLRRADLQRLAEELLADPVVERTVVAPVGDPLLCQSPADGRQPVHVLPKPGVMDPVAQTALSAIADFGLPVQAVRTLKKYWIPSLAEATLRLLISKILANDAVEQAIIGPLDFQHLEVGSAYRFQLVTVPMRRMDDEALERLSREGQLYLSLVEMQTIRAYYRQLGRDPTDAELETLAQTWSEHCSHKTLAGRIEYRDERGQRRFENMLRETIFAATNRIRRQLGEEDWCVSVFQDNAGVVRFDDRHNVVFKVETHNHPSALEPYGGANTGIGGVIRDPLGTGLGARPICNTDVFCFAPPDTPAERIPAGVLHPRRVMTGVVAGVRDYGNRMGIPTVSGAVYFDPRYVANPLVYCGNVGLIPREKSHKEVRPGDLIVAVGGRTGRDGIHGATFSSAELTSQSETVSGGAVQIGNAITEKMLVDVLMVARDRGLYHAITDCGAGGFSSAVGEMGSHIGAEVWLEKVPLKYEGLSYTEIWISEAQERMVLAVPPEHWDQLHALCRSENVEATVIGRFEPTGRLRLLYDGHQVADLDMHFLHEGRPPVVRQAVYEPRPSEPLQLTADAERDYTPEVLEILGSLNVASKHWIIRQYDHEVQGGSVIKPLVGAANDGPSDAAVLRPVLDSHRGIVVACGMNPCYGDLDTYWMAASAIDEAVRNCVAVGADPRRIALLDNFCWGNTDRPETLGSLVRAALACHDMAVALGTPFISGKDSLNNEFRPQGADEPICIPPSLLISALGQVADARRCVTMDLKRPGNAVYLVGTTRNELGGSHWARVQGLRGGQAPQVDARQARQTFLALHQAIDAGRVRACHDLSEGGLAVAAAEMAFAGAFGLRLSLAAVARQTEPGVDHPAVLLFSESNTRFLCEVEPQHAEAFEQTMDGVPCARLGEVTDDGRLEIISPGGTAVVQESIDVLKQAWLKPLDW
ncbi:MAG TPA: phosphoribosylformylglycinamidine synthase subunit PurL [Planctomycetaceae bacterium]|nr:phosphoribosylformylglycinamidine synthase subunit PurL [Planctomycetaceae bacterium]HIQ20876.1 phosphoribosylformylglycinamidine synthase subunit PurL [Planctomycetota bacterium]